MNLKVKMFDKTTNEKYNFTVTTDKYNQLGFKRISKKLNDLFENDLDILDYDFLGNVDKIATLENFLDYLKENKKGFKFDYISLNMTNEELNVSNIIDLSNYPKNDHEFIKFYFDKEYLLEQLDDYICFCYGLDEYNTFYFRTFTNDIKDFINGWSIYQNNTLLDSLNECVSCYIEELKNSNEWEQHKKEYNF